jgi:hypothetical protein
MALGSIAAEFIEATSSTTSSEMRVMNYNDAYETCERTVIELRIYSDSIAPAEMSRRLAITPSPFELLSRMVESRFRVLAMGLISPSSLNLAAEVDA